MSSGDYYSGGGDNNSYPSNTGTSYGGGGYAESDYSSATQHAISNSPAGEQDSSIFSSALGALSSHRRDELEGEGVDEEEAVRSHQAYYGGGGGSGGSHANSGSMGSAAAMQALKMVSGGGGGGGGGSGGGSKNAFIGMAMGQASRLFDEQKAAGNAHPDATKQGAVQAAAKTALKMYMKSEMGGSGGHGGGQSSGGGLMGMASQFMR